MNGGGITRKAGIAAIAIAFVMLLVWALMWWHEGRMQEGFDVMRSEVKSVAFVNAVKQAESFDDGSGAAAPLMPPASLQQKRKTSAYLRSGIATFFGINDPSVVQDALTQYLIFFQPTESDLLCDFTNISTPTSCLSPLDTISANDMALAVPPSIAAMPAYAISSTNATDTRVFVLGSAYHLSRIAIKTHCLAAPRPQPYRTGAPVMLLALPNADYATRLIMLLRPTYIRAMSAGAPASMLYWVDWNAHESSSSFKPYNSQETAPPGSSGVLNAIVTLVQVAGFDDEGVVDPIPSTPLPSLDVAISGTSQQQSGTKLSTVRIASGSTTSLVLYYPKYSMPTPMGTTAAPPVLRVATVCTSVTTGSFTSLNDADGMLVMSVSCPAGSRSVVSVSVPAGGGTVFDVPMPSGSPAYAMACASYDLITVAVVTPSGSTIYSRQLISPVSYYGNGTGSYKYAGGAGAVNVGLYCSTSIPNYADIALSLGCLQLPPSVPLSGTAVETTFETFETVEAGVPPSGTKTQLKQGQSLLPGQSISSPSGAFVAIYQLDGQLAVYSVSPQTLVWSSGGDGGSAGKCTLGHDGILRLTGGGPVSMNSRPYWTSGTAAGADQAPFVLQLVEDPPGQLQIVGRFSSSPVWGSV